LALHLIGTHQYKTPQNNGTAYFENCKQLFEYQHAIYSYLETSGGESSNLYLNVVHFFNTRVNETSVAAQDSCFSALVYALFHWDKSAARFYCQGQHVSQMYSATKIS